MVDQLWEERAKERNRGGRYCAWDLAGEEREGNRKEGAIIPFLHCLRDHELLEYTTTKCDRRQNCNENNGGGGVEVFTKWSWCQTV